MYICCCIFCKLKKTIKLILKNPCRLLSLTRLEYRTPVLTPLYECATVSQYPLYIIYVFILFVVYFKCKSKETTQFILKRIYCKRDYYLSLFNHIIIY